MCIRAGPRRVQGRGVRSARAGDEGRGAVHGHVRRLRIGDRDGQRQRPRGIHHLRSEGEHVLGAPQEVIDTKQSKRLLTLKRQMFR